jgi:hypothetical protein
MNRVMPLLATQIPTLWIHTSGGGGGWGGSDIRSMSSIRPICKCRCPPLLHTIFKQRAKLLYTIAAQWYQQAWPNCWEAWRKERWHHCRLLQLGCGAWLWDVLHQDGLVHARQALPGHFQWTGPPSEDTSKRPRSESTSSSGGHSTHSGSSENSRNSRTPK